MIYKHKVPADMTEYPILLFQNTFFTFIKIVQKVHEQLIFETANFFIVY
jgi:hypothetical protein